MTIFALCAPHYHGNPDTEYRCAMCHNNLMYSHHVQKSLTIRRDWWSSTLKKRRNSFSQCVMCLRSGWSPTLKMMKQAHVRTHLRPGISSRAHVYKKQNKLWVMYGWDPPLQIKLQTQKLWKTKWEKKLVISDPSCKINTGTNTNSTPGTSAGLSPVWWVCFSNSSNGFHSFTQAKEEFRSL